MTYSIVARDEATGRLGVAVQSHWFSVGSVVSWAEAGVGAIATQSFAERSYGPLGLELMRRGRSAPDALAALVHADDDRAVRQVAYVDAEGRAGVHTGDECIREAGHLTGDGYSVQANMMERGTVWGAMDEAYRAAQGDLPDRMLTALAAAQGEGGDIRGTQSAAILVVEAERTGTEWGDRILDLRVEDHATPVDELARLVRLWRAYGHAERAEGLELAQDLDGAMRERFASLEIAARPSRARVLGGDRDGPCRPPRRRRAHGGDRTRDRSRLGGAAAAHGRRRSSRTRRRRVASAPSGRRLIVSVSAPHGGAAPPG